LQLNATTNPKPNPNPDPIFNANPKTNLNSTPKSDDLNMSFLVFRCP